MSTEENTDWVRASTLDGRGVLWESTRSRLARGVRMGTINGDTGKFHGPERGQSYVVIESTPGYMPEDCDPFITDDYAAAVACANEEADELEEQGYECDRPWASRNNLYAIHCTRPDSKHDLGRFIAVELDES